MAVLPQQLNPATFLNGVYFQPQLTNNQISGQSNLPQMAPMPNAPAIPQTQMNNNIMGAIQGQGQQAPQPQSQPQTPPSGANMFTQGMAPPPSGANMFTQGAQPPPSGINLLQRPAPAQQPSNNGVAGLFGR